MFLKTCFIKFMNNRYRKKIINRARSVGEGFKVNGKSYINGDVTIGNNVNFNGMQIRGVGSTVIGNNFHSGVDCVILTSNHNYEGTRIPYDSEMIRKQVIIEDNVWIGDHVMILGGVVLREGCIIQAGSVVSAKEIPKCAIAGGNPAKVFKYRDIDHYEKLKAENMTF